MKKIKKKMLCITLGMIAFVLAAGINIVLIGKMSTTRTEKIRKEKNYTIPLSETVALDMVWIESGTFKMGSPKNELCRDEDEVRHKVTLTKDYWLGKYEVSQAQYKAVMGYEPSGFGRADLPVWEVSWYDAMAFCQKLTVREKAAGRLPEGYEYTLPTEAQWEYACRAGTTTALNNGMNVPTFDDEGIYDNLDEVGWYKVNLKMNEYGCMMIPMICISPVGWKKPNAWGLYDMHGNVCEWCLDWYGSYPSSAVTDPKGASTGSGRVMRGGSCCNLVGSCRSANRSYYDPISRDYTFGFRVCLSYSSEI